MADAEADRAWATITSRGASTDCPFCGRSGWEPLGSLRNLRVVIPAATPHGELLRVGSETSGIDAYPYMCRNCGFIRLHAITAIGDHAEQIFDEPH
jgi:predicted RNA-binding Zn-ribbon protein involved in translation (DUF1610 family)